MFSNNNKMISYLTIVFFILIENANAKCGVECGGSDQPLWEFMLMIIGIAISIIIFCVCVCVFIPNKADEIKKMYLERNMIRDETKTSNTENEGNSKDLELPSSERDLPDTNKITITINNEEYEATLKRTNPKTNDERLVEMESQLKFENADYPQ